jgi:ADP-ribosylation factor GTPase-activating protein 1
MSSAASPSLSELQQNPMAALGKGWSLFSAAVAGASRVVSENVIQPGMEKVADPNLQASVKGYVSEAQKRAAIVGSTANQWSKNQFGVDVAESVGGVVDTVKDKIGGGPTRSGYGSLAQDHEETSGLYHDGDDGLFTEYSHSGDLDYTQQQYDPHVTNAAKKDDWDEWKEF